MRFRALLLDVGDTLIGPARGFGSVYAEVFAALGVEGSSEAFAAALRAEWHAVSRRHPPGRDRYAGSDERFWRGFAAGVLARVLGRRGRPALVNEAVARIRECFTSADAWEVFPDVKPTLGALRAAGLRLAVVSNWDSRLPGLLERLGLADYFDALAVSHHEGWEKPSPQLFQRALGRLGVEPRDALHVGDLPELDWAGARSAGCAARLVDRRARLAAAWDALADLGRLPAIVGQAGGGPGTRGAGRSG